MEFIKVGDILARMLKDRRDDGDGTRRILGALSQALEIDCTGYVEGVTLEGGVLTIHTRSSVLIHRIRAGRLPLAADLGRRLPELGISDLRVRGGTWR